MSVFVINLNHLLGDGLALNLVGGKDERTGGGLKNKAEFPCKVKSVNEADAKACQNMNAKRMLV